MTAQRSMTDEQMLAKYGYDKEPWVDVGGNRFSYEASGSYASAGGVLQFAPRPECIPSRPQWTRLPDGTRMSNGFIAKRPPVNPILSVVRFHMSEGESLADAAVESLHRIDHEEYEAVSRSQIDFARKVLTRLASLQAVSQ